MQKTDLTDRILADYIFGKDAKNDKYTFFDILKKFKTNKIKMFYIAGIVLFITIYGLTN